MILGIKSNKDSTGCTEKGKPYYLVPTYQNYVLRKQGEVAAI